MRLQKLRITSFGAIESVEVEFGPGLNVLYGPNDLGKSTVVAAIRLGLLLPHGSTYGEQYIGWKGTGDPTVEVTFETEAQRIWRVRKQFGKAGSSVLHESRNGRDFDEVERGRKVDGRLREILRWGIPEPGGTGGAKGLPTSFLATALLSPQDDVGAVLRNNLQEDLTASGKEQISAALQAIAQDPLFADLLREAQAYRDAAYTDKGAKKTAKGSVFKAAAERLNETRDEKERLERIVFDSEDAEKRIRDLIEKRTQRQSALATATELGGNLERSNAEVVCRSVAAEQVRLAQEDLQRIQRIGIDKEEAERETERLVKKIVDAEQALNDAKGRQTEAQAALKTAEEATRSEGSNSGVSDTVVRQQLELRNAAADKAVIEAQQQIEAVTAAQKLIEAVCTGETELTNQEITARRAAEAESRLKVTLTTAEERLRICDVFERALDVLAADKRLVEAQETVDKQSELRIRLEKASAERAVLAGRRAVITVPTQGALNPMRQLENELAAVRGALDVGLMVTVTPKSPVELLVRKDGQDVSIPSNHQPVDIEAKAEIEIGLGDVATVNIRGGRRESQEKARNLVARWSREVQPHIAAAGVTDLAGLDAKSAEARELDSEIRIKDRDLESLRAREKEFDGAAEALREASDRAATCRAAMGDIPLDTLDADLKNLGTDAVDGLRKRRHQLSKEADAARASVNLAATDRTLAEERVRQLSLALHTAILARNTALAEFAGNVDDASVAAQGAWQAALDEKAEVTQGLASLEHEIEARKNEMDRALKGARTYAEQAAAGVETAQGELTAAKTAHANEQGRLVELRKRHNDENAGAAEARLQEAVAAHAALPVPEREVNEEQVEAARGAVAEIKLELDRIEREILQAQGALNHVGGAVARERLRDATEAFELAERRERETEMEYEAWKLLLEQMKESDAAQASNLGQALGPAITGRFQELTRQRYEAVRLNAQLATEGVLVSGSVRSTDHISVGTREQLSTLYRISLAEYLGSTIVLDDQLVQSDGDRMEWFRALLGEKARNFQILVFTCRPDDYLDKTAMVPKGNAACLDTDGGFVRAVDLGRALLRR